MSGASSNVATWFSLLEPAIIQSPTVRRPDDPRLGDIVERWDGNLAALRPGRAVIVGFPQDEGVRRNGGRVGAAKAPDEIRRCLHRLASCHAILGHEMAQPPLDVGNLSVSENLEESQEQLGEVVGGILKNGAIPVVLGGGHETAYGHYLGYVKAKVPVGIINIDAHLDVRPLINGLGHSGSPFRQAMEHPTAPLQGRSYCCVGAQPFAVSLSHKKYVKDKGGEVWWFPHLTFPVSEKISQLRAAGCKVMLTIDADAFASSDVPGVSAPNPDGFRGGEIAEPAHQAGRTANVSSLEVVEINPLYDIDHRSARWAAMTVWYFLIGLAQRAKNPKP